MSNNRQYFLCLVALLVLWVFSAPAQAQIQPQTPASVEEPLTITDVVIDKTDKSAVTARDQAIVEAQRLAFQKLAEKSMTPEAFKSWQVPDDKTIAAFVHDFEIRNEQISVNRYLANFTVRFNPQALDYIKGGAGPDAGSALTSPASSPALAAPAPAPAASGPKAILVLPYFKKISGKNILWEDPNPWREAWQAFGNSTPYPGLTITVPLGDITDISFGSSDAVWNNDYSVLEKLRANYNAGEVVLAVANKSGLYVQVDIYIYRNGRLERQKSLEPYTSDDDYKAVFQQTVTQLVSEIKSFGTLPAVDEMAPDAATAPLQAAPAAPEKPMELQPAPEKTMLETRMDFSSFKEWMEAQKRLLAISPSLTVEISSLSKNAARFTIAVEWAGGVEALKKALAEKGLDLEIAETSAPERPVYTLKMN
jgi:hypothetical protein